MKSNRTHRTAAIAVALMVGAAAVGAAQSLTGREIAERVDSRPSGNSTHALVQMQLIDAAGAIGERVVEMYGAKDADGLTRSMIIFHHPASVAGTRFLTVENQGRDDDQWIYLPALRRVRRIAASEGSGSFMGTDFTYDDLKSREIDNYEYRYLRDDTVPLQTGGQRLNRAVHVVEATPKPGTTSQYARIVEFVDPISWTPIRIELYDARGELVKVNTMDRLENVQGYWTVINNTMQNARTGHRTVLNIQRFEYDKQLPAGLFTQNFLQTGRP